jgi:hypothetical protein
LFAAATAEQEINFVVDELLVNLSRSSSLPRAITTSTFRFFVITGRIKLSCTTSNWATHVFRA